MPTEVPAVNQDAKSTINFPIGPLSSYRRQASFCWKKMQTFIESEDIVQHKVSWT